MGNSFSTTDTNLGDGDYGSVVLCEKKGSLATVIKRPTGVIGAREMLEHEAEILRAIEPHARGTPMSSCVPIFLGISVDGLMMDYKQGTPLDELLEKKQLTDSEMKTIILKTAEILQWLVSVIPGFCHNDLHPGNLIVDRQSDINVAIIDFGKATIQSGEGIPIVSDILHLCETLIRAQTFECALQILESSREKGRDAFLAEIRRVCGHGSKVPSV